MRAVENLKTCTLMGYFCRKYMFGLKKDRRDVVLKHYSKFEGKLTCGLKTNMINLVNFHASCPEPGSLHFDGLLLIKGYEVAVKIVQRSYLS